MCVCSNQVSLVPCALPPLAPPLTAPKLPIMGDMEQILGANFEALGSGHRHLLTSRGLRVGLRRGCEGETWIGGLPAPILCRRGSPAPCPKPREPYTRGSPAPYPKPRDVETNSDAEDMSADLMSEKGKLCAISDENMSRDMMYKKGKLCALSDEDMSRDMMYKKGKLCAFFFAKWKDMCQMIRCRGLIIFCRAAHRGVMKKEVG